MGGAGATSATCRASRGAADGGESASAACGQHGSRAGAELRRRQAATASGSVAAGEWRGEARGAALISAEQPSRLCRLPCIRVLLSDAARLLGAGGEPSSRSLWRYLAVAGEFRLQPALGRSSAPH